MEPKYPASQRPEDLAATARADAYMNRQYLDPVFFGSHPEELREIFGEAWPDFPEAEIEAIREKIDFLGINYYTRSVNAGRSLGASGARAPGPAEAPRLHRRRIGRSIRRG